MCGVALDFIQISGEAATIIPNSAFRIPNLNKHLIVRIELVHNRHDEQDNHHQHQ